MGGRGIAPLMLDLVTKLNERSVSTLQSLDPQKGASLPFAVTDRIGTPFLWEMTSHQL